MSDLGGIGGALLLSDQISTDRLFDSLRRAREANNLALNDAAWRNQYNDLVNRYNRLLQDANQLADAQDKSLNAQAGEIAELKATKAMMAAQIEQLKFRLASVEGDLAMARALDRELHPDAYRYTPRES
jgi:hypothetical protein